MDITEFPTFNKHQLYMFASGSGVFVYGPSGAGKSLWVTKCLLERGELFKRGDDVRRLIVCYRMWQPYYERLRECFAARGQQCIFHDCSTAKELPITELFDEIGANRLSLAHCGSIDDGRVGGGGRNTAAGGGNSNSGSSGGIGDRRDDEDVGAGCTCVWFDDITATFSAQTSNKLYDILNVTARHRRLIVFITAHSITKNMSGSGTSLLNVMQCCSVHVFFADARTVRDMDQYSRFYGRDKERRRLLKVAFKIISSLHYACLIVTSNKNVDERLRYRIMFADGSCAFMSDM